MPEKEIPEKPKKPMNAYFRFRAKRMKELANESDRKEKIK